MARGLSATLLSHLEGSSFTVASTVSITTGGTTYRFTNLPHDIEIASETYTSSSAFLGIGSIEENMDLVVNSCSVAFSALDSTIVTNFGNSNIINAPVQMDMIFLDPTDLTTIIGDPVIMFKGKVKNYTITDEPNQSILALTVTSIFVNFQKTSGRRTSFSNFQREHPTDKGMEFSHEALQNIPWGRST